MSNKKVITTALSPKAIGPYSQAILIDGYLFTSGQIPLCPVKNKIVFSSFEKQAYQTLNNLKNLLKSEDFKLSDIIKITVFLTNLKNFDLLNKIFAEYFIDENYPARSVVEVSKLPKNSKIEIEAICKK